MRTSLKLALAASALVAFATPAAAADTNCYNDFSTPVTVSNCTILAGNLNSNNPADITATQAALASIGFTGTYTSINQPGVIDLKTLNGTTIDFGMVLSGINYISAHYGAGQDSSTVFYQLDIAAPGLQTLTTANTGSLSNAVYYGSLPGAVPEPATWAMMLIGFGAVGTAMSRRKKAAGALQIA